MDYRLVKQYLNDAIDNFFNFFYKIMDFGKVLFDTLLAFGEIWYHFFMFFVNIFLYCYYLFIYGIDKLTLSSAPVFFWKKSGSSTRGEFVKSKAYNRTSFSPASGAFGSAARETYRTGTNIASTVAETASSAVNSTVGTAQAAAESVVASHVSPRGTNLIVRFFSFIGRGIAGFFMAIGRVFSSFWSFILSKMVPVKEQPVGRKNLIDDYLKNYDQKKFR